MSGVLLALVAGLRAWLKWVGPLPGDRYAIHHLPPYPESALVSQWTAFFQDLGTAFSAVAVVVVSVWVLARRTTRREAAGVVIAVLVVIPEGLIKQICGPTTVWVEAHRSGANYPSGHVAFAVAVIGYLGVLGYRRRQPEVAVVSALLVISMGPARVVYGAHVVSDAIGGYLLGAGWLILVLLWVDRSLGEAIRELARSFPRRRALAQSK